MEAGGFSSNLQAFMKTDDQSIRSLILYVENNPDDITLLQMGMKRCNVSFDLETVPTVEQAEAFLESQAPTRKIHLVLLDYNLGWGHSGLELISWMHEHGEAAGLPVVVYCGDESEELVNDFYKSGAQFVLEKPDNYPELLRVVKCLDQCLATEPIDLEMLRDLREYRPPDWRQVHGQR